MYPYFSLVFSLVFMGMGINFWLKGTGRIKSHPDYQPSLGIFKVCGVVMGISGLVILVFATLKLLKGL